MRLAIALVALTALAASGCATASPRTSSLREAFTGEHRFEGIILGRQRVSGTLRFHEDGRYSISSSRGYCLRQYFVPAQRVLFTCQDLGLLIAMGEAGQLQERAQVSISMEEPVQRTVCTRYETDQTTGQSTCVAWETVMEMRTVRHNGWVK